MQHFSLLPLSISSSVLVNENWNMKCQCVFAAQKVISALHSSVSTVWLLVIHKMLAGGALSLCHWWRYSTVQVPLLTLEKQHLLLDIDPLTLTLCMQPFSQFLSQQIIHPSNPYLSNLEVWMLWGTISRSLSIKLSGQNLNTLLHLSGESKPDRFLRYLQALLERCSYVNVKLPFFFLPDETG